MSAFPENPGSFKEFARGYTHHAVITDISDVQLRYRYDDALTAYRESLAAERSITPEELHTGKIATRQMAEVATLPQNMELAEGAA